MACINSTTYSGTANNKYTGFSSPPWRRAGKSQIKWIEDNLARFIFPPEWVVNNAVRYQPDIGDRQGGGVYFLIDQGVISYVGIAYSIRDRITWHHEASPKVFDSVWWFGGMAKQCAEAVETFYIYTLQPRDNRKLPRYEDYLQPYMDLYMEAFDLGNKPDLDDYYR